MAFSSEIPVSLGHGFLATTLKFLDRLCIFLGHFVDAFSASFITASAPRHTLRSAVKHVGHYSSSSVVFAARHFSTNCSHSE